MQIHTWNVCFEDVGSGGLYPVHQQRKRGLCREWGEEEQGGGGSTSQQIHYSALPVYLCSLLCVIQFMYRLLKDDPPLEASLDNKKPWGFSRISFSSIPKLPLNNIYIFIYLFIYLTPFKIHGLPFPFSPSPFEHMYSLWASSVGFFLLIVLCMLKLRDNIYITPFL